MIVTATLWMAAVVLLLPVVSDLLSLARLARGRVRRDVRGDAARSRILYLVPAHDEELLIETCVESVLAQEYGAGRVGVVVLADNCRDRTAELARACGAKCLERHDPERPGKPQALAWAFDRLDLSPWDAVVILDADAVVARDHAAALDRVAPLRNKVAQSYNDVRNPGDNALTRLAAVFAAGLFRGAYTVKQAAGLNTPLSAGLCLGTGVLARHPWNAFSLSEDVELYAQLTAAGVPIHLVAGARIHAMETQTLRQSGSQRSRWMAGRLDVLARVGPRIVRSRAIGARQKLDALCEIAFPGPALHTAIVAALVTASAAGGRAIDVALLSALAAPLGRHAVYGAIGLSRTPEPMRAVAAVAFLPFYALWRCVTAVRSLALLRSGPWIRTAR